MRAHRRFVSLAILALGCLKVDWVRVYQPTGAG